MPVSRLRVLLQEMLAQGDNCVETSSLQDFDYVAASQDHHRMAVISDLSVHLGIA